MSPEIDLPKQPNYLWHWVGIIAVFLAGFYLFPRWTQPSAEERHTAIINGSSDWYFIAKMPEVPTTDKDAVRKARVQFREWLTALGRAGFQPMLLSEVVRHWNQGAGLPEKAIVLVFEPGYRATYEALAPVLEEQGVPAVWLTPEKPVKNGDFRYISRHVVRTMERSDMWDVGFFDKDNKSTFSLLGGEGMPEKFVWAMEANWQAKNRINEPLSLHRLAARSDWSVQDLMDQLNVELPLKGAAHLFVRSGDRLKAVHYPATDIYATHPFTLAAKSDRRTASVFWPSTEGIRDFTLDMTIKNVDGEFWTFLRSDEAMDSGVRIGFTKHTVTVEQNTGNGWRQLMVHNATMTVEKPLYCKAVIIDRNLRFQLENEEILNITLQQVKTAERPKFGVMVYERIRGFAHAENVTLTLTPLSQDLVKIVQSLASNR